MRVSSLFLAPVRDHTRSRYETNEFGFVSRAGYRQVGLDYLGGNCAIICATTYDDDYFDYFELEN